MEQNEYKETEKLLAARFSGALRDIKDPGNIKYERARKKESFFSRTPVQLVSALLAAALVGGGTFTALKLLEKHGADIAGTAPDDTALTAESGTDADRKDGEEIYVIELESGDPGEGEKRLAEEFGIEIIRKAAGGVETYTAVSGGVPVFTARYGDDRIGYPKNILYIKNNAGIMDTAVYVTYADGVPVLMCCDLRNGTLTEADVSALASYTERSAAFYMYVDAEGLQLWCAALIPSPRSDYETEYTFALENKNGRVTAVGDPAPAADIPDASEIRIGIYTGENGVMNFIGAGTDPERAPSTGSFGDPDTVAYKDVLDFSYDENVAKKLFSDFGLYCVYLYDDGKKVILSGATPEEAAVLLGRRKRSVVYVVARFAGNDGEGIYYYDHVIRTEQWSYESYDIDVGPIPDSGDMRAPVFLEVIADAGKEQAASYPVYAYLHDIREPSGTVISTNETNDYGELTAAEVNDPLKTVFKYDEECVFHTAYVYGKMKTEVTDINELPAAIAECGSGARAELYFRQYGKTVDAQYNDVTVYTYVCPLMISWSEEDPYTDTDTPETDTENITTDAEESTDLPPETDTDYIAPDSQTETDGNMPEDTGYDTTDGTWHNSISHDGEKSGYPATVRLNCGDGYTELTGYHLYTDKYYDGQWISGDGMGAYGAENVTEIGYSKEISVDAFSSYGEIVRLTIDGLTGSCSPDQLKERLDDAEKGTYRIIISCVVKGKTYDDGNSEYFCYEYPADITVK